MYPSTQADKWLYRLNLAEKLLSIIGLLATAYLIFLVLSGIITEHQAKKNAFDTQLANIILTTGTLTLEDIVLTSQASGLSFLMHEFAEGAVVAAQKKPDKSNVIELLSYVKLYCCS